MKSDTLVLIPGPTPVVDEVLEGLARPVLAHTDPRFVEVFRCVISRVRQIMGAREAYVVAGTGTLSMEMALVNTLAPGERVLVVSHGYFGDRFVPLARAFGIEVDVLRAGWGKRVPVEEIGAQLGQQSYRAVTITHVDTSTGVVADIAAVGPVIREAGALFILDGVCATGGIDEDMEKYGIDVVLTGSQKALGVPPGLALVGFGPRALEARARMSRVPAYYSDIANWRPVMEEPSRYFATPAVNMVFAMDVALDIIFREGLTRRYGRHLAYGRGMRAALRALGLTPLPVEEAAASTTTTVVYPEGLDDATFRRLMAARGITVAGALGPLAGKAFRVGHMGNVTVAELERAVQAMAECLAEMDRPADGKGALRALGEAAAAYAGFRPSTEFRGG
ncbi:MAG: alanine--glyoxylate aminotransferase family protein [Bacillota bacterium]|nr:alanine--glyoxylate aminotransferase family protein [Bacillota bacterium]